MPKMQEQFFTAMDGGDAENAGAIFGRRFAPPSPGGRGEARRDLRLYASILRLHKYA
jgi:hypothetical protein